MDFTGERFIPSISGEEIEIEHMQRYRFAMSGVKDKIVLDAACGEGYGSALLAENAKKVYGIDISEEAIENAQKKYSSEYLDFRCASIENIPLEDNSVDCVVSFETIEHVDEALQHRFMKEIKRVLKPDGFLLMSTPNKRVYTDLVSQENSFHVKEFYGQEFFDFLHLYFKEYKIFSQYFEVCSVIENRGDVKASKISSFDEDNAKYYIALCSDTPMDVTLENSVVIPDQNIYANNRSRIVQLQEEEQERNAHIVKLDATIDLLRKDVEIQKASIAGLETERDDLLRTQKTLEYKNRLVQKKYENMSLQKQQNYELCMYYKSLSEAIQNSRSYRLAQKISKALVPMGSRRRTLLKKVYRAFRPVKNEVILEKRALLPKRRSFEKLEAPQFDSVQVSIVIPVYNQFEYTYHCIDSIIKNTVGVNYEIIVADDVSDDRTQKIRKYIQNINVIRNEKNIGFLRNCNNAAKTAKGKYILFLNNDTQVRENWLRPLVDLIEEDEMIGLVGSKLIGADGKLQEAGGVIWKDASGWNYGLGNDPDLPEYNYVKEVDYISGASMMIRKELWQGIGGFDTQYIPAYFEDSDLAFEVRKRGYKVIYQPLSEVIHFEGISNGTDETQGIKHYQVVNRDKFIEKWAMELEKDQFENAEHVFYARDRSMGKRTILVVDHYVPHFDKDAGSRTVFSYLKMFVDMGMNVKFIGDNFCKHEPYTTILEQMGIEVLYGEKYANDGWKKWIDENAQYIDVAMLNRPHIACKYIDYLKEKTHCKIVYFGHDLHCLREMREYEITGNEDFRFSAEEWRVREYELMEKADQVIMVSEEEKRIIKEMFDIDIKVIPIFYFDTFENIPIDYTVKKDLLFVGGFAHRPNIDGLEWFVKEIFPEIQNKFPEIKLHVVGSNPTKEVLNMASQSILVHGYVSDEELKKYYADSRVCVVPLRYGAGIKGKTIEAMYNRIAIVSTTIGIEGLKNIEKIIEGVDTPKEFAAQVIKKYKDASVLKKDSEEYIEYLKQYFSYNQTKELCKEIF